ncbi:MAG TPA: SDR family NAD(P)-dependent oxidoreductase [Actinomycetaceae bacterium]|nr:SDR family NAD(P)-dependent oxidoreductase [Actinomycetaceae bacterium]
MTTEKRRALVTGASTGIGLETVRALVASGWEVIASARREDRLRSLAAETGCDFFAADLTVGDDVARLTAFATSRPGARPSALVNVAGGAEGVDTIASADIDRWQSMYDKNVLATLRLTRALLPHLRESGGDIVFVTSTAAHDTYPGGGGYAAAKHAERMIPLTLRQELVGEPVRIIEIAPGMVRTPEFSLNRLGSQKAADAVYAGVAEPLVGADVAEAIRWTLSLPRHMNVDSMILRPVAQATNTLVARVVE